MGGGTTKLQGGNQRGKKRGLRVYDGQRVPLGTLLAKQFRLDCLPGWNVSNQSKETQFNIRNNKESVTF